VLGGEDTTGARRGGIRVVIIEGRIGGVLLPEDIFDGWDKLLANLAVSMYCLQRIWRHHLHRDQILVFRVDRYIVLFFFFLLDY